MTKTLISSDWVGDKGYLIPTVPIAIWLFVKLLRKFPPGGWAGTCSP